MAFARRVDKSQSEIVYALRRIGAKVRFIGQPLDLLVGFRGRNILLEVKTPKQGRLTQEQQEFLDGWPGEAHVVETIEQAVAKVVGEFK